VEIIMNEELQKLVSEALGRKSATETEKEAAEQKTKEEQERRACETFKNAVVATLGEDVLRALGPLSFEVTKGSPNMNFFVDGQNYSLKELAPSLVQLEVREGGGFYRTVSQFPLSNNARNQFLVTLGEAAKQGDIGV
jgi:hypothetical protein